MKTEEPESADQIDDHEWADADDQDVPAPTDVLVNAEERIPDEAGYGYGV